MSAPIPLDDRPRDLAALYEMHDALSEEIDALSDRLGAVEARISDLENGDWTAYRDCVSGEWRRSER
jgi:hypothetical protein